MFSISNDNADGCFFGLLDVNSIINVHDGTALQFSKLFSILKFTK